jgi:RNA polymerase sigma-70 factor (ECF subfamily)
VKTATAQGIEEALARSARGDSSAFATLVREHQAIVFSMACYYLHNRSLAEDVAQEVFLRLYRNLAAIRSPAHLLLWLRQVTVRLCIDQARRAPERPHISLEEVAEPTAERSASDLMLVERLRRLVASLPENARMVVILRYQEELDLAEIAEVLRIPINTVKSRLQRSLAVLREKLAAAADMRTYETARE